MNDDTEKAFDLSRVRSSRPSKIYMGWGVIALSALWLHTGFPAHVIAFARFDDALFVRLARFLLLGQWLGPFDNLTLVKGMGYPLFIAAAFGIGVPLKIAEALLYIGVALMGTVAAYRASRSPWIATVLLILLAFNAVTFSDSLARVIREGIYVSLTMLAVLLASLITYPHRITRAASIALTVGTGFAWAWFYLTREEGVWLAPSILVALASGFLAVRCTSVADRPTYFRRSFVRLLGAFLVCGSLIGLVAATNYHVYGKFATVEVNTTSFKRGYAALYRVQPDRWRPYIVFPADVRRKIYAVSEHARSLAPAFEGKIGEQWRRAGCEQTGTADCPEILAGWFQWALRDAVTASGHYTSADDAAMFYDQLADEIDMACRAGKLTCTAERVSLAPPFRMSYIADSLTRVPQILAVYWNQGLLLEKPSYSVTDVGVKDSDPEAVMKIADFIGNAQPTEEQAHSSRMASDTRNRVIARLTAIISMVLAPIVVGFAIFGVGGLALMLSTIRRSADVFICGLVAACYGGVVARIALLCYLDATAIPSINILYASPASPLLIVAGVLGTLGGWQVLKERFSSPGPAIDLDEVPERASRPGPIRT